MDLTDAARHVFPLLSPDLHAEIAAVLAGPGPIQFNGIEDLRVQLARAQREQFAARCRLAVKVNNAKPVASGPTGQDKHNLLLKTSKRYALSWERVQRLKFLRASGDQVQCMNELRISSDEKKCLFPPSVPNDTTTSGQSPRESNPDVDMCDVDPIVDMERARSTTEKRQTCLLIPAGLKH